MNDIYLASDSCLKKIIEYMETNESILSIALGGSRSKQYYTEKSDYDLFCVIESQEFANFRKQFVSFLERSPYIQYATEFSYVENWGYMFKTVYWESNLVKYFDISIIPLERIGEMSFRNTNICLFDRINCVEQEISRNERKSFDVMDLEPKRQKEYVKLFGFEYIRLENCIKSKDYWFSVRCLERMKTYYIRYVRIRNSLYSKHQECPEKYFLNDFPSDSLHEYYRIDGTFESLIKTRDQLISNFRSLIYETEIIDFFINICTK